MRKQRGFLLVELVVVFGMVAVLVGMTTLLISGAQRKATLTGTIETLVVDIRSQQTKAMSSVLAGETVPAGYGIRFETTRYILYSGVVYNSADTSNAVITLDPRVTFSAITLPDNSMAFAAKSGEIVGFSPMQNTVVLHHMDSGETKTIQMNRYGIITSIQ
jgi:type II secretory pathway pseudopilin PulG